MEDDNFSLSSSQSSLLHTKDDRELGFIGQHLNLYRAELQFEDMQEELCENNKDQ